MKCKKCKKETGFDDNLFCDSCRESWRKYCIRNKIDKYIKVVESDIPKKEIVSKTLNWYH
jgi:hypothetical protein